MSSQALISPSSPSVVDHSEQFQELAESRFATSMDVEEAITRTSETLGVVVHCRYRNKNSAKVVTSAQLYCKHGRTPSTTHGNSGKTDCPFVLQYKWDPNDSSYVIEPINTVHNHPIVVRTTGVTGLPEALKWRIREMKQQEASSSTIMEMLRQEGQPPTLTLQVLDVALKILGSFWTSLPCSSMNSTLATFCMNLMNRWERTIVATSSTCSSQPMKLWIRLNDSQRLSYLIRRTKQTSPGSL